MEPWWPWSPVQSLRTAMAHADHHMPTLRPPSSSSPNGQPFGGRRGLHRQPGLHRPRVLVTRSFLSRGVRVNSYAHVQDVHPHARVRGRQALPPPAQSSWRRGSASPENTLIGYDHRPRRLPVPRHPQRARRVDVSDRSRPDPTFTTHQWWPYSGESEPPLRAVRGTVHLRSLRRRSRMTAPAGGRAREVTCSPGSVHSRTAPRLRRHIAV
jgi:hypothetical protein